MLHFLGWNTLTYKQNIRQERFSGKKACRNVMSAEICKISSNRPRKYNKIPGNRAEKNGLVLLKNEIKMASFC